MIEIEIPCSACTVSPFMAIPYTTEKRLSYLQSFTGDRSGMPRPVVKQADDGFICMYGWDIIQMLNEGGKGRARVLLLTSDRELEWCITKHVNDLDLPWTSLARALYKAKTSLNVSDHILGERTGIGRTSITKMINIVKRLHPGLLELADKGRISYSNCRRLVTLPHSVQEGLLNELNAKHWNGTQLMAKAFPGRGQKAGINIDSAKPVKSRDINRFEIDISEKLGYPVEVNPSREGGAGTIEYLFFDRIGMIEVLTKLRNGFAKSAKPNGRIVISFESLDELDGLTQGFFGERE